jgi:hypothetical protein
MNNFKIVTNPELKGFAQFGSKDVHKIYYIPKFWNLFFVSAYPDVFNWCMDRPKKEIDAFKPFFTLNETEFLEHISDIKNTLRFYRTLIGQYLDEGNTLTCKLK